MAGSSVVAAVLSMVALGLASPIFGVKVAVREPAEVQKVPVPRDVPAYVLTGEATPRRPLVYLPGRCGDAFAAIKSWPETAKKYGTLVVVQGDEPCPGSSRRRWSGSAQRIHARLGAAMTAASEAIEGGLEHEQLTLIGYSEGAARAELLAKVFPDRYQRVLLLSGPREPSPVSVRGAKAVVTMAGGREDRRAIERGTRAMQKAGLAARFFVLPGARHGEYGPQGARVMDEALDWVFSVAP